ncbi:hypothetical protein B0H14DRAFT_2781235 [Mycena olivaceomarginata]|nr:hypothetical protein B0H14DRAFT_2781235 [Mycena olivaceomarginata]
MAVSIRWIILAVAMNYSDVVNGDRVALEIERRKAERKGQAKDLVRINNFSIGFTRICNIRSSENLDIHLELGIRRNYSSTQSILESTTDSDYRKNLRHEHLQAVVDHKGLMTVVQELQESGFLVVFRFHQNHRRESAIRLVFQGVF